MMSHPDHSPANPDETDARKEKLATDGLIGAARRRMGDDPKYFYIAAAIDEYFQPGRPKDKKKGMPT